MDFTVILERKGSTGYHFEDDQFEPFDTNEESPTTIFGEVFHDGNEIGQIVLYEFYNNREFLSRCDSISGDCSCVAGATCGKSGAILKKYLSGESEYDCIYILDKITINKEYRNQGIGSAIIKNLLKMIRYQFGEGSTIFLCASDYETAKQYGFESDEYEKGKNRLIQFYTRLGFRVVKDNVMVYNELGI